MTAATSILPAAGWADLLARLEHGTLMVVGAPGTGKTCLARYLVSQLDRYFTRVALIDADLDRVSIGVPGCLALALTGPWEAPARQWMVEEADQPARRHSTARGTGRLAREARQAGAEAIVLDTPGFTGGDADLETLADQALAAGVERVVAIERPGRDGSPDPQVDRLLERLGEGRETHRLQASSAARCPTLEEQLEKRGSRLRAHFFGASLRRFEAALLATGNGSNGRPSNGHRSSGPDNGSKGHESSPEGAASIIGQAVGLLDEAGYCLGLGRLQRTGPNGVEVMTPVRSDTVARLALAGFRLAEDGSLL